MDVISLFNSIRDIPYRIPLKWGEEDNCCSGKHARLLEMLTKNGYETRYEVCVFLWSDLNLPKEIEKIPHENDCTHTYLRIKCSNEWKILDATWDIGLKSIFHVNNWDGKSDTKIAVKPVMIFNPEKSLDIVKNQNETLIKNDLKINGNFYKAFNDWLEKNRNY